jgi:dipeptidyl-peptidase 4
VVVIFTNSVKVWRQNTRGDYWTFHRSSGQLAKLGGDAKPSTLMCVNRQDANSSHRT